MFSKFKEQLKHRLMLPLPGTEAQLRMAHEWRRQISLNFKIPDDARLSAVLILFYEEENKIKFPLILRQQYDGVHSGQISFPGGRFEKDDAELSVTALRETEEEIGVLKNEIEIIGKLTELYIPPSNFLVHPFVAVAKAIPDFIIQNNEVEKIIIAELEVLFDEAILGEKEIILNNGRKIISPVFNIQNHIVWGATAMMLSELQELLKEIV